MLDESASLIYDSKNSSSAIKLIESDSTEIIGDVYLFTGSIWNSGDLPITKENIRIPISFELNTSCRILDFKIVKQKEENISSFELIKTKSNSLTLDWKYFDPGFGLKFQIIYIGESYSGLIFKGKILDIKHFYDYAKDERPSPTSKLFFSIAAPICIFGSLFLILYGSFKQRPKKNFYGF